MSARRARSKRVSRSTAATRASSAASRDARSSSAVSTPGSPASDSAAASSVRTCSSSAVADSRRMPSRSAPLRSRYSTCIACSRLPAASASSSSARAALGEHGFEPLLRRVTREPRSRAALARLGETLVERREVELREPRAQPRDLEPELLRPLGGGRLQGERPEALPHLVLEVARALDLNRDARELQLRAMAPRLEASEPGGLLDQRAPLLRLRREDRLDLALADDRVHALAEAEVGEQLDEVDPAHGRLVDEVLALAAAVQAPRDRQLRVLERAVAVLVVEQQLDLAEVGRPAARGAGEEHVVRLLRAQLVRAERPRRPADRVRDVRLAGAVRPDDHADAPVETNLDRVGKRLEATELYRAEMHAGRTLPVVADG